MCGDTGSLFPKLQLNLLGQRASGASPRVTRQPHAKAPARLARLNHKNVALMSQERIHRMMARLRPEPLTLLLALASGKTIEHLFLLLRARCRVRHPDPRHAAVDTGDDLHLWCRAAGT